MMQVAEYVQERIANLRREHMGQYNNIACLRTNSQKFLVHYFHKGQLKKLFFLFPVSQAVLRMVSSCLHLKLTRHQLLFGGQIQV